MSSVAAASRFLWILIAAFVLALVGCTPPTKPAISIVRSVSVPASVPVNASDHNSGDFANFTTQSETSHAVFEKTIAVAWNDNNGYVNPVSVDPENPEDPLFSVTAYGVSTDDGVSFLDTGTIPTYPGFVTQGDPAVAVDEEGNFYFVSMAADSSGLGSFPLVAARSKLETNGNTTFDAPANAPVLIRGLLTENIPAGIIPFQDKPSIAVDTSRGSFSGTVYVVWSEFSDEFRDPSPRIRFTRSTCQSEEQRLCPDLRLAFATPIPISPPDDTAGNHGAMPAVGPAGEVYVVWGRFTGPLNGRRRVTGQDIRIVKSMDGGNTFCPPGDSVCPPGGTVSTAKIVAEPNPEPSVLAGDINIRTRGFPYIAVDHTPEGSRTRGNVYVVYQADPDGGGPDRSDIFFTRSIDGGITWSPPRSINRAPAVTHGGDPTTNDNWQPSIAASPTTGEISVTFYDRRNDMVGADSAPPDPDPPNTRIMLYRAVSTDGGHTWFNEPVSDSSFQPATGYDRPVGEDESAAYFAPDYFGDYNFSFATDTHFHYTWGDSRELCEPPPAAAHPCDPAGRPDQNVRYANVRRQEGPDLFIRPWGDITGEGPRWQSPDVFVVNNDGAPVNPKKGAINNLQVRVRNVGNKPARQVKVVVKYAPLFANITENQLKDISSPQDVEDIEAGGVVLVPITWDLRDLDDTNGDAWPKKVGEFSHFCVRVTIQSADENNTHNNSAHSNFVDVTTESASLRFLIANTHDTPVRAMLTSSPLPKGFRVKLKGLGVPFGHQFALGARETRVATLVYSRSGGLTRNPPREDVVADVSLHIEREVVGGFSVRLFKGIERKERFTHTDPGEILRSRRLISGARVRQRQIWPRQIATAAVAPVPPALPPQPQPSKRRYSDRYRADLNRVADVILAILRDRREPVAFVNRDGGVIKTGSVSVSNRRLKQLVPATLVPKLGRASGRYLLGFRLQQGTDTDGSIVTIVTVMSLIIVRTTADSPMGGRPIASNGVLENEYLRAIARAIQ